MTKHCKKESCKDVSEKKHCKKDICKEICDNVPFKHQIQLYLGDAYGVEVPNTAFWITLTIVKDGPKVTIQFPVINFETGQFANNPYEIANPTLIVLGVPPEFATFSPPPQNGGYLFTKKGFLPKCLRPNELQNLSYFAASNNGMNSTFNYIVNYDFNPPVTGITNDPITPGYILQINNIGALIIQGMGTFANIIPPGTQSLMPTSITYIVKPKLQLCDNIRISHKEINTAVFPFNTIPANRRGAVDALRDSHINDAFDNVVAYAWSDNSFVKDKPNNPSTMGLAVAIGKVKDGQLKMRNPKFIPTPTNFYVWDTAIAINRKNKKNIVVSYGLINFSFPDNGLPFAVLYRAVSNDGGKTWPINGPTNIQPTGTDPVLGLPAFGDAPGVQSDQFGNIWYLASNLFDNAGNTINQGFVMVSTDGGNTYQLVFTFPFASANAFTDLPSMCFGGDGLGNYGAHLVIDYVQDFQIGGLDLYPEMAFIPITGLGLFGTPEVAYLPQFTNNNLTASIAASVDGKVWTFGSPQGLVPGGYAFPGSANVNNNHRIIFKSPGPIDENYVGPWTVANANLLQSSLFLPQWTSQPIYGMFQSQRQAVYDDCRQALYILVNKRTKDAAKSQIYLLISRDNGASFSQPVEIATTTCANRGFQSMQLDTKTGNLLMGWYDGRDYKNLTGLNYYGAVITACQLDEWVKEMKASNPLYIEPAFVVPEVQAQLNNQNQSNIERHNKFVKAKYEL
jgi:hypothetical protein